ncbi:S-adenosyl-L-methionine-dependent methyltransferase [Hypoxylon sp. FL1857]|nr:S-adenosyl-L-methionine-dependent methyltransferase [Hypoxylon sp. FL1857]
MPSDLDAALVKVRELLPTVDGERRISLIADLHELANSLETPDDTVHRYGAMNLQTAAVKIGFDLGLFKLFAKHGEPIGVDDMAAAVAAETPLLARILKYLAAIGTIDEVASDRYAANHLTNNLSEKVAEAGICHYFATAAPQYQVLPEFLKRTGYKNPTDALHTVCQDAFKTDLHQFVWFAEHPENLAYFNDFMAFRREPELSWLTVYPVQEQVQDWDPERPVYVNMGGGIGHQCAQFLEKYPHVPGRVILQDLPHSIAKALPTPRVENMVHNFFDPQPIKGAKFYFLRGVCHNHPTDRVKKLLENIKQAMEPDSIILLDEWILPDTKAHIDAVSMDLTMLTALAGEERSERKWRSIIDEVGLELVKIYVYNAVSYECVMDVRLPAVEK